MRKLSKRGQLTIFIIIAILIVGCILGFFVYRNYISNPVVSSVAKPVYDYYISCIEQSTLEAVSILESKGGYIETPNFEAGSSYMPSSSQLDFLGTAVPYWFYISGNNIRKEQVPKKSEMEFELRQYIQENLQNCDFSEFEERGYLVDVDNGSVEVRIESDQILVDVKNDLRLSFGDEFYSFSEHQVIVNSKLGKFYDLAKEIYEKQKEELFLENYALDTLSLNAPTTGFEEGCTPKIFNFPEIRTSLADSLSENFAAVKIKGTYYSDVDDYYVVDFKKNVDEDVNFLYSSQWPTKIEIYGDEIVEPVGLQEGLEVLGFCFVEYELIYDLVFPVMIQISDGSELFQFPVIVFVERSQIDPTNNTESYSNREEVVCKNMNSEIQVKTVDVDGNFIPSTISMSCLGERCYLGETDSSEGNLITKAPTCANGFIEAKSEGYSSGSYMISTNKESSAEILMKKIYDLKLDLGDIEGEVLIQFTSDDFSRSVMYPDVKEIQLVEGIYDVEVQVFGKSGLVLPARTEQKCFESTSGLSGLFGNTQENCMQIQIPEQEIDQVLIGGGKSVEFISDSTLKEFSSIEMDVPLFDVPSGIEGIGENYIKLEDSFVSVVFRP